MVSINYVEYSDEIDEAVEAGKKSRFWRRFTIFAVLLAIAAGCALFVRLRYLAPVDVKNATPDKAVGWLMFKDLSQESEENQEQLFDMYIGSVSVPDVDDAKEVSFQLPKAASKVSGLILSNQAASLSAWKRSHDRDPYLRIDYVVRPAEPRESEYVTSRDVKPGPALLKRWDARQEALKSGDLPKRKAVEKNVQLILMRWFVAKYKAYDAAPDDQKKANLDASAKEMLKFQKLYNKLVEDAGQSTPSRTATLQQFEMTADGWLELAKPEELAKVLWFKDLLVSVAAQKIGGLPQSDSGLGAYPHKLPAPSGQEKNAEEKPAKTELKAKANALLEAAKRKIFTEK